MADEKVKHPDTTYKAKYPYNQTHTYESGHTVEFDNTPGKERIRISHKHGTYAEVNEEGRLTAAFSGHAHIYGKNGFTITSDKSGDIKINGHARIVLGGGSQIECKGDLHATVAGDLIGTIKGGGILAFGKSVLAMIKGNLAAKVDGTTNVKSGGDITMKTDGAATVESSGTMTLKAPMTVLDSADIRLGGEGANRELALKGSIDTGGDSQVANLSTRVRAS